MSVRYLPRGAKVADAAFPNASFPAALAEAGYEAFCGYLSSPTSNGKNWNATRLGWFWAMGCGMFCEQYETIVLEGYSANNIKLGQQCEQMANDLGVPLEAPMWFAVDTSPFGHFSEIAASFQAYNDTNRRPIYAYCGSQCGEFLMDEGLIEGFHVPSAVSWSATNDSLNGTTVFAYNGGRNRWYLSPLANMLQRNSIDFAGSRIDPNDVLRPTPFWFPSEPVPTPPIEPEEVVLEENQDMAVFVSTGAVAGVDGVYELIAGTKRHVTDDEWYQVLKGLAQRPDGSWPSDPTKAPRWQPVAYLANGYVLAGMPNYVAPTVMAASTAPTAFDGTMDLNAKTIRLVAS